MPTACHHGSEGHTFAWASCTITTCKPFSSTCPSRFVSQEIASASARSPNKRSATWPAAWSRQRCRKDSRWSRVLRKQPASDMLVPISQHPGLGVSERGKHNEIRGCLPAAGSFLCRCPSATRLHHRNGLRFTGRG